jgi:hypothetical protein
MGPTATHEFKLPCYRLQKLPLYEPESCPGGRWNAANPGTGRGRIRKTTCRCVAANAVTNCGRRAGEPGIGAESLCFKRLGRVLPTAPCQVNAVARRVREEAGNIETGEGAGACPQGWAVPSAVAPRRPDRGRTTRGAGTRDIDEKRRVCLPDNLLLRREGPMTIPPPL